MLGWPRRIGRSAGRRNLPQAIRRRKAPGCKMRWAAKGSPGRAHDPGRLAKPRLARVSRGRNGKAHSSAACFFNLGGELEIACRVWVAGAKAELLQGGGLPIFRMEWLWSRNPTAAPWLCEFDERNFMD